MTIITPGDDGTLVVDDDGNGFVIIDGIAYPVTVDPDDEGDGEGGSGGGYTDDEAPLALRDTDFIYLTLPSDTLFNGHSLFYVEANTNILLDFQMFENEMGQALWNKFNPDSTLFIVSHEDKTDKSKVSWSFNSQQHEGAEYSMPLATAGSHQLLVDATDALKYRFEYWDSEFNEQDTILKFSDYVQDQALMTVSVNISQSGILHFRPIDENHYLSYGFDDGLCHINQQNEDYEVVEIGGTQYHVPWMGVLPNQEVQLKLQYISANPQLDSLIVLVPNSPDMEIINFETDGEPLFLNKEVNVYTSVEGTFNVEAYSINKNNQKTLIGKLNLESRNLNTAGNKTIRIIRVKRSDEDDYFSFEPAQKQQLVNQINQYYKQSFLEFTHDNYNYSDTLSIAVCSNDSITSFNSQVHKVFPYADDDVYHIYICSRGLNRPNGIALMGGNAAILFLNQNEALKPKTAAHEMGHNLGLQHTWSADKDFIPFVLKQESRFRHTRKTTHNIMDYYSTLDRRRYFWYFQIQHLKNR